MNTPRDGRPGDSTSRDSRPQCAPRDDEFDARLRQCHAQALDKLSPRTLAQLGIRRGAHASQPGHSPRVPAWGLAAAFAVGALVVGLALRMPAPSMPAAPPVADAPGTATPAGNELDEAYAVFDESPDLYLWLDSEDARIAME